MEMAFCLKSIIEFKSQHFEDAEVFIAGWSMGGAMAWFAPYFLPSSSKVIILGSCARYADLIKHGRQNVHGLYYFPNLGPAYFDIDQVARDLILKGNELNVIFGERDQSCLKDSLAAIENLLNQGKINNKFKSKILPNIGHSFKEIVPSTLSKYFSNSF